jgi:hypothetical protein
MSGACSTNGGQEERVWVIGAKTRGKETARKTRWIILGWILEREDGAVWTGLVWLRIGTSGELL